MRKQNGVATNDLIFSAMIGNNADLFPEILKLHVKDGSNVADITYGRGVFWKNIQKDKYQLKASDIKNGVDCRDLPYNDMSMDAIIFDPPYMHTPGGSAHQNHQGFEKYYQNNKINSGLKYYDAVLDLYIKSADEAHRVLKNEGVYIVKCQDQVCSNRQRLNHIDLVNSFSEKFYCKDIFVLVRKNKPGVSRILKQVHARKNHSYFLVFIKRGKPLTLN